jgi:hypothetical protein
MATGSPSRWLPPLGKLPRLDPRSVTTGEAARKVATVGTRVCDDNDGKAPQDVSPRGLPLGVRLPASGLALGTVVPLSAPGRARLPVERCVLWEGLSAGDAQALV